MSYVKIQRRWFKPWKVEYSWAHSAYGAILGYTWTRWGARRKLARSVPSFIAESEMLMWGGDTKVEGTSV